MRKNILILGHNDATQFIDIFNQYARLFDKNHYEVTVAYLTGAENKDTRERTIAENVLFLDIPKRGLRYLKIKAMRKLHALCKEKKFSIVICHRYKPTYLMLLIAQLCQIEALFFVMHELRTMKNLGRRLLIRALLRDNMVFAGVSNAVRNDMQRNLNFLPKERLITLYNVIDFDLIQPQLLSREEARKQLGLSEDAFIYGNLGRLVPNKDQATLITAFSKIKPHCPNAKLVIAGSGALEANLRQQVNGLNLQDHVVFTGFIAMGFRYMKAFDCFVLSSVQEAFGRVLLEAMIAKLPIIATAANGIPEVMGDIGMLIKPRDIEGLSHAMQTMYDYSKAQRQEEGERGYQHALTHFSILPFQQQFWQHPVLTMHKD